jgi:ATP-binding cassette, subfamily C (CFTR/MRP), member 1
VVVISLGYSYFAAYYRESAREMKRLDSSLRSLLYSHFAESLSGLATIRAYGETNRFIRDDHYFIDLENRALFLTITNQASVPPQKPPPSTTPSLSLNED